MAAASESRVLRFFGVEEAQVRQAASGLAGRCSLARIETRAQGAETLLALTAPPAALRKAEGLLARTFPGGLYGAGGDTLARCAARALVQRDRLLACADTLALDLLAPRLEGQAGVDACFDFGAGSCADPAALARIEAGARRCQSPGPSEETSPLCRSSSQSSSAQKGATPDFCGSSPILICRSTSCVPPSGRRRRSARARSARSSVCSRKKRPATSLALLVCTGPMACQRMSRPASSVCLARASCM